MGSFPGGAGGPGSRRRPGGHQSILLLVSAATSSACGPRSVSLPRHPRIRRFLVNPRRRGRCVPLLWEQGQQGRGPGSYPSRLAWNLRASASRTRWRRRPHRLPLQTPSSTMAPTSALVTVSAGMTVSLLEPLVSIHDNSRRRGLLRIENVLRDRRLRSPPDDWERTAVIWRTTQSS